MNLVLICNLIFYISPYIVMVLYNLKDKIPSRAKTVIKISGFVIVLVTFSLSSMYLIWRGYTTGGEYVTVFGYMPTYLLVFYSFSAIIGILAFYIVGYSSYDSLQLGFILAYVVSFYWEIPENIFWQLRRGYHPAMILALLGVFPYIWLDKTIGWYRNKKNVALILAGWATTTLGVLTLKSNIYTGPMEALYFLLCRAVGLLILIKIFALKDISLNLTRSIIYLKWGLIYAVRGNWAIGSEMAYWDYEINYVQPKGWILPLISKDVRRAVETLSTKFNVSGREIKVLELGPGPRSRLTDLYDKEQFDLVAVDILADPYKKHLNGRKFLLQCSAETVGRYFPKETFHMFYSSNALDHCQDIQTSFQTMIDLTKVGGFVIIQGNIREGERLHWIGLHKYSIWIEDGNIMCDTRDGEQFMLNESMDLKLLKYRERVLADNSWYSVMYCKMG